MNVLSWVLGPPEMLSGAIDVVGVRRTSSGSIECSPFHVKVLNPSKSRPDRSKIVTLTVNGRRVALSMKVGPAGEAFFVERVKKRTTASSHRNRLDKQPNADNSCPQSPKSPSDSEFKPSPLPIDTRKEVSRQRSYSDLGQVHQRADVKSALAPADTVEPKPLTNPASAAAAAAEEEPSKNRQRRDRAASDLEFVSSSSSKSLTRLKVYKEESLEATKPVPALQFPTEIPSEARPLKSHQVNSESSTVQVSGSGSGSGHTQAPAMDWTWTWGSLPVKAGVVEENQEEQQNGLNCNNDAEKFIGTNGIKNTNAIDHLKISAMTAEGFNVESSQSITSRVMHDSSIFFLSLCGRSLCRFDHENLPVNEAALHNILLTHRVHARELTTEQLSDENVVVVLDNYLLTVQLLENVLVRSNIQTGNGPNLTLKGTGCLQLTEEVVRESCEAMRSFHQQEPSNVVEEMPWWVGYHFTSESADVLSSPSHAQQTLSSRKPVGNLLLQPIEEVNEDMHTPVDAASPLPEMEQKPLESVVSGNPGDVRIVDGAEFRSSGDSEDHGLRRIIYEEVGRQCYQRGVPGATSTGLGLLSLAWRASFSDLSAVTNPANAGYYVNNDTAYFRTESQVDLLKSLVTLEELAYANVNSIVQSVQRRSTALLPSVSEDDGCVLPNTARSASKDSDSCQMGLDLDEITEEIHRGGKVVDTRNSLICQPDSGQAVAVEDVSGGPLEERIADEETVISAVGSDSKGESHADPIEDNLIKTVDATNSVPIIPLQPPPEEEEEELLLSLADIPFEAICPEPAHGEFYESDTESFVSGESGRYSSRSNSTGRTTGENSISSGGLEGVLKSYKYRKVLVPPKEHMTELELKEGENEVRFQLEGSSQSLTMQLFVWPEDAKLVVVDIDGVVTSSSAGSKSTFGWGLWSTASKADAVHAGVVDLLCGVYRQGYQILYIAQNITISTKEHLSKLSSGNSSSSGVGASASAGVAGQATVSSSPGNSNPPSAGASSVALNASASSAAAAAGATATSVTAPAAAHSSPRSSGLPPGPVFQSPDHLLRAFGTARPEIFKAAALRGLRGLFSSDHNPFYAAFCSREQDTRAYGVGGVPEGRTYIVGKTGEIRNVNRTFRKTFAELNENLQEMFPWIPSGRNAGASTARSSADYVPPKQGGSCSSGVPSSSPAPPVVPPSSKGVNSNKFVDDSYNDFNYWKMPIPLVDDL